MIRIGVDTGGTFTDLVKLGPDGIVVHKVRSTPDDPAEAILGGIGDVGGAEGNVDVVHGSTVATNAVLERKGARVALLATAGFEDVLHIGRQTRRELYNLMVEGRRPLVEPALTFGVDERLDADGRVLVPLDPSALEDLALRVRRSGATAVAVCFLHAYRSAVHEEQALEILERCGLAVSASHRVLCEYREFERWSTTVVNAYVTPLMSQYLAVLEARLGANRLSIMQSNGGSIAAATARAVPVRTILSGPAAGVVGARAVAEVAGYQRIITFDMGGTSTDVSLIDGAIGRTTESSIGDFPVRLPIIDIHTVGAGGGSIAYADSGGALRVGPRSAGADPGPVCYGRGLEPTVTDANLLLGRLDASYFLGGRMALDVERARAAVGDLAGRLGLGDMALAEGIVRVANANMERAIRVVSVQRGFDPRDFALLAFGGAGGMHACEIAATLEIATVIVPRHAGVLSALGMLLADVTKDYSISVLRKGEDAEPRALQPLFEPLVTQARTELAEEGFTTDTMRLDLAVDVRYVGQSFEITVPFSAGYREEFDGQHARLYGYANPRRTAEVVNLRVTATGLTRKPQLPRQAMERARAADPAHTGSARFAGRIVPTRFYRWESLVPGSVADGPAVVAGGQATAVVPPGFSFRIDEFGNLVAVRTASRRAARRRERVGTGV
jgi:N-methylhydantoinase A/oxoprolinase/acetone carboxylase beta subunit